MIHILSCDNLQYPDLSTRHQFEAHYQANLQIP